jgi:hypothetical protein
MKDLTKITKIKGFIFAPCCYCKGSYDNFIGKDILSLDEFRLLGCITEWKNNNTNNTSYLPRESYNMGVLATTIIDSIRISQFNKNNKFSVEIIEYVDAKITPKNILLIGKNAS